ncbi:hypothetical protein SY83_04885 [Paenibacillus swuensis]|uniref:histidine kinase n=1 Tax=Paenibacillus swuensis TaxID=1178515 RepID=A0A172TFR0_9BACL|nr:histidine kinase [Paenibacillus swuensis]ANE45744.1 hypothetical protein SY83_04885 [Paenibacillus swuensis]
MTEPQLKSGMLHSLKTRLIGILVLSTLIPVLLIGSVSYYSIYYLLQNKVEKGIRYNLQQEKESLVSILENLDYASRQLAFEGQIGTDLRSFLVTTDPSEKLGLTRNIEKYMDLVGYTNPNLGFIAYYLPREQTFLFDNQFVKEAVDFQAVSKLSAKNDITYYGPHPSLIGKSHPVLSILRPIKDFEPESSIGIYVETNFKFLTSMFKGTPYGMPVSHIVVNAEGRTVYTENDQVYPLGETVSSMPESHYTKYKDYYVFGSNNEQGWKLLITVDPAHYSSEIRSWLLRYILLALLSLLCTLVLGWFYWRAIYRPLLKVKKEMQGIGLNSLDNKIQFTQIREFDDLLLKFDLMRGRIAELLQEVENKERNKRLLEVEKLLYQMNPHFIHNTINTAQWLAMINGQDEIVKLLATFSRLLNYNMGKEGGLVPVRDEIHALKDYVTLQQIRYDHKFKVEFSINELMEDVQIPRFLLQPLVENAMYHGFRHSDGTIRVIVQPLGENRVELKVEDNGAGMTQEEIQRLFENNDQKRKSGLGIGLSFVNNIVQVTYGTTYKLEVKSKLGEGTEMKLVLPVRVKEEEPYVKSIGGR